VTRPPTKARVIEREAFRIESEGGPHAALMAGNLRKLAESYPDAPSSALFATDCVSRTIAGYEGAARKFVDYLDRHAAGDFGTYGLIGDAADTEAARWVPWAFGQATANAYAIRTNNGIVRSRFRLPTADGRFETNDLGIATLLRPGLDKSTIIYIIGVGCIQL
jgi:hypothetical protein